MKLENRYDQSEADSKAGPPNAEKRGVSRILANSIILGVIALAIVGVAFTM